MEKRYDLIIIGSGPAGLSAAVYAGRAELSTLVIEKEMMGGGQIVNTTEVDNYLGLPGINGFEMGVKFQEHAKNMGAEFVTGTVESVSFDTEEKAVVTNKGTYKGRAVLIASGAAHRKLDVPGELEFSGKGVSYCATCDGAFFRGRTVAVIGGGDVAVGDAIFLARLCKKVYLIHRRDSLRAAKALVRKLEGLENVEFVWDTVVEKISGSAAVESLTIKSKKNQAKTDLAVDGVFVAVGMLPNTEAFKKAVKTDEAGYIMAGEDCITSQPGIFAAGDVRTKKLRQIITAASDGANAITSIEEYFYNS